jgi:protein gp37
MPGPSAIEWTQRTWNPVTGCDKVSPGCAHCYAETFAERWRGIPGHPYEQGFDLKLWPERLDQPLRWRKPRMIFVNSMSDLFHEDVPFDFVREVIDVMAEAERHTFQVLTKRPERIHDFFDAELAYEGWYGFPDNVWVGVSIENRRYVHRADILRDVHAGALFISAEPLLGPLINERQLPERAGFAPAWRWEDGYVGPSLSLAHIDWLIAGAESGHGARPMNDDWVRGLRDACRASGTAFFFKQRATPAGRKLSLPELDGRTWDEFPAAPVGVEAT